MLSTNYIDPDLLIKLLAVYSVLLHIKNLYFYNKI